MRGGASVHASIHPYVCLSVRSPISHHNFAKCGLIVTKRYMEVAGHDTAIVQKYHGNRSKVKFTKFVNKST